MIDWQPSTPSCSTWTAPCLTCISTTHFWLEHVPHPLRGNSPGQRRQSPAPNWPNAYDDVAGTIEWYCVDYWSRELGLDIALLKEEVAHLIARSP